MVTQSRRRNSGIGRAATTGVLVCGLILGSAALPLIGYVLFVLNYLMLDVIRAILAIPEKLDVTEKK